MRENDKHFYKNLFVLVLPIAFQNLMSALVSASDAMMLGMVNQDSLSAVSLAAQVQFVLSLFWAALTIGTTILAAQYWGKNDRLSVEKILAIVLKYSFVISFLFFAAAALCPQALMRIFTNDVTLIALGAVYLRIVSWSYLLAGISQIYLCIMRNSGRTLKSTVFGSVSMVLNILLNGILIFGLFGFPKLGISGAAIATVIARAAELGLAMWENCKKDVVRIHWSLLKESHAVLRKDFVKYTSPVMANELVWGCGFTMFTVIMGHLGSDAVAANSIAGIVKNLISCLCIGIGSGSGIIVGNELGSGNLVRAREYGGRLPPVTGNGSRVRRHPAGVQSLDHAVCRQFKPTGTGVSAWNAVYVRVLSDCEVGQYDGGGGNLLRGRRHEIRLPVRHGHDVDDYRANRPVGGLCL